MELVGKRRRMVVDWEIIAPITFFPVVFLRGGWWSTEPPSDTTRGIHMNPEIHMDSPWFCQRKG
eukprot:SAG22_NODE_2680_length_2314_cov_1.149436_4_plen_64_part_00